MLTLRLLVLMLVFSFAGVTYAEQTQSTLPKTFRNQYVSSALGFKVTVTHELKRNEDGTHEMHFNAKSWFATIDEVSRLRIDPDKGQIIPLHYVYKRRVMGKDRDAELTFNWDQKTVTNNVQNTTWKMNIEQNIQDKLSYQLQLQQDLINGKNNLVYQIADGGRLKEYRFETVGEELLNTPLGKVKTVKVKRSRDNDDRVTYAWLAIEWDHILVRMQQEEDGKTHNIDLSKAFVNGKAIEKFN